MSDTIILCGCSREGPGGKVLGAEGCEWCGSSGLRRIQCIACADSGHRFGSDDPCDCPAGLPHHAKTEPSPEAAEMSERHNKAWKLEAASF